MQISNLKKYISANIAALWSYYVAYLIIAFMRIPEVYNHNVGITYKDVFSAIVFIAVLKLIVMLLLIVPEFLIRKYVSPKIFLNFKYNIKIKIPDIIISAYAEIFWLGIIIAGIIILIILLFLLYVVYVTLLSTPFT